MKVKLDYRMTVQEARMARCAELQESEVTYSEAPGEAAAKKSHECATLRQINAEHMRDLEAQAIRAENRSHQDFPPSATNAFPSSFVLSQRGAILFLFPLLGPYSPFLQHIPFTPASQAKVNPSSAASTATSVKPKTRQSSPPKRWHSSEDVQEDMSGDEDFPPVSQEEHSNPKRGKMANWQTSMKSSRSDTFCRDSDIVKEARVCYFATHPWDWTQRNMNDPSDIFRGLVQSAGY